MISIATFIKTVFRLDLIVALERVLYKKTQDSGMI